MENARYKPTSAKLMVRKIIGRDSLLNHGCSLPSPPLPGGAGRTLPGGSSMSGYSLPFAGFLAGGAAFAGFLSGAGPDFSPTGFSTLLGSTALSDSSASSSLTAPGFSSAASAA